MLYPETTVKVRPIEDQPGYRATLWAPLGVCVEVTAPSRAGALWRLAHCAEPGSARRNTRELYRRHDGGRGSVAGVNLAVIVPEEREL
jgi:hypothetical protein